MIYLIIFFIWPLISAVLSQILNGLAFFDGAGGRRFVDFDHQV